MRYFDLHCDTLVLCAERGQSLLENELHVSVQKGDAFAPYVQCLAIFVPDNVRGSAARAYFDRHVNFLAEQAQSGKFALLHTAQEMESLPEHRRTGFILTVEGGAALGGVLENVEYLYARGVRMMTLTWNGSNEIGSGVLSGDPFGLTPFGIEAVRAMERTGITVDVSHASERLFYDVAERTEKPFVASHSNAAAVCKHPRNLTDDQFAVIRARGGLVGLNFYKSFLNDAPDKASMEDIFRHAEHFLALGGEDVLAMGSDFDGSTIPDDMRGLESVEALMEVFLRHNLSEALVDKIFFANAAAFFAQSF